MTPRPFRYNLRVRYGECDVQKVVYNPRYADYVDLATLEFLRAIGYGEAVLSGAIDYQVAKLTIEWKAPARFDDVLEISVYAARLGNTSFTIAMEFRIAGNERVIATAETVYVLVNFPALTKTPLPPDFRTALEKGRPAALPTTPESPRLLDLTLPSSRRYCPMRLIGRKFLPVFNLAGRREHVHDLEINLLSFLRVVPRKGPDISLDDQLPGTGWAAIGWNRIAVVRIGFRAHT